MERIWGVLIFSKKVTTWSMKLPSERKTFPSKTDDLSLITRTHSIKGKKKQRNAYRIYCDHSMCCSKYNDKK